MIGFKRLLKLNFCNVLRLPTSNIENFRRIMGDDNDILFNTLTPEKIVDQLNKKVIGQQDAKVTLAIAFRNRLRRMKLSIQQRQAIKPSNILMEGPTGCGKSELCKALASLSDAPFVRVQATKYTEVGYVGKDVTSIGSDLMRQSTFKMRQKMMKKQKIQIDKLQDLVNQQIVNSMLGIEYKNNDVWLKRLKDVQDGLWDDRQMIIPSGTFFPDQNCILTEFDGQFTRTELSVKQLKTSLKNAYQKKIKQIFIRSQKEIQDDIIKNAQQNAIVFIDEIDKITSSPGVANMSKGVSTQGVQRDFLPLLQGTILPTTNSDKGKHLKTDNILFIAGGSFARAKVEDLLPQLLGRLPVKVNLKQMKQAELVKILRKQFGLLDQQTSLFKSQGVNLQFSDECVEQIARIAYELNINTQNIGARRLMAMIDKIMKDYSFKAHQYSGTTLLVNKQYVKEKLKDSLSSFDMRKRLI